MPSPKKAVKAPLATLLALTGPGMQVTVPLQDVLDANSPAERLTLPAFMDPACVILSGLPAAPAWSEEDVTVEAFIGGQIYRWNSPRTSLDLDDNQQPSIRLWLEHGCRRYEVGQDLHWLRVQRGALTIARADMKAYRLRGLSIDLTIKTAL